MQWITEQWVVDQPNPLTSEKPIILGDPKPVPGEAGLGKAKLTFSMETWKEGKVASTIIELPVVKPEAVNKQEGK